MASTGTLAFLARVMLVLDRAQVINFTQATATLGGVGIGGLLVSAFWLAVSYGKEIHMSRKATIILGAIMVTVVPAVFAILANIAYFQLI